ncbi:MAG: beta-N-acetylhexosaminidase [bacterium]|nr:beta-N-acetylhexosaminidase [bacterium]
MNVDLSLRQKIGQLFMIGFKGKQLPEDVRAFMEAGNIGAVILFARNIESPSQASVLNTEIHNATGPGGIRPFIFTDQEGGTVVQFKETAATVISAMGLAAAGDPVYARKAANIIASEMKAVGIDCVLAPVLDVNYEEANPIIGIRSYSDEPETVIRFAREFAAGLEEKGIASCAKHYPGHGGTTADSHLESPKALISPEYFYHYCYSPFYQLAREGIDAVMSSHVLYPALSSSIATFSPFLINDLLRKKAAYDGVVISDCLEMKAVKDNFSAEEIIQNSMDAGIDMFIVSHTPEFQKELMDILYFYVEKGKIPEKRIDESLERVLKLKQKYEPPNNGKGNDTQIPTKAAVQANTLESPEARPNRTDEQEIADRSITLLRNESDLIPMKPASKTLILEWAKVKATMSLSEAESISVMAETANTYLDNADIRIFQQGGGENGLPAEAELRTLLDDYDCVIAGLYSRTPQAAQMQAEDLKQILQLRSDVIVVALGNPYDIRYFPNVGTYIATYGFRRVQVEALFKVLTGQIPARGKLPVQLKSIFPRGFALSV